MAARLAVLTSAQPAEPREEVAEVKSPAQLMNQVGVCLFKDVRRVRTTGYWDVNFGNQLEIAGKLYRRH